MKKHVIQALLGAAILAAGGMAYRWHVVAPQPVVEPPALPVRTALVEQPRLDVRAAIPQSLKSEAQSPKIEAPPNVVAAPRAPVVEPRHAAAVSHGQRMAQRFAQQEQVLSQENDPAKRIQQIQMMARSVRSDTLGTLDWAMSLEDPAEKRAALAAIRANALVGIGARIAVDETGLPKIVNTTVLSAVAATGMTEPGDYISGMVAEDGSTVDFKGRPIRQIIQFLHGAPGTEIQLIMERAPTGNQTEPYAFQVPVQRSMIIVQPPE